MAETHPSYDGTITMMNRRDFLAKGLGLAATLTAAPALRAAANERPSSGSSTVFEFAVVGAGLLGSAAARHLSEMSDSVALIGPAEPSRPQAHHGVFASYYDASRLTRIVDPDLVWATLARRSVMRYRDIEMQSGIDLHNEIGYMMVTPGGLGKDWFDLPAMREVAADLGVDIEDLDDASLRNRFPWLRFTPGSSAVLQPRNAGYLDPRRLVEAQQEISLAQGTTLLREEVTGIESTSNAIEIRTRTGMTVRADRVLLATGAYTNASGLLRERLDTSIRAAMIMLSEVARDSAFAYPSTLYAKTDGEDPFWGLLMPPITYPDGRSYIKTMDGYYGAQPLVGYEALGEWMRSAGHEDHHHVLRRALHEVFPSLEILSSRFQPCLISDTASRYPYIDMVEDRVGIVVGGNGKSAKSSDEIGRLAAGMMHTGSWQSSLPQSLFAARFSPKRP